LEDRHDGLQGPALTGPISSGKDRGMVAVSLQSGSSGNCIFVEAGNVRLLFDAGICGAEAERRLSCCGYDIRQVDALIISHDHSDHALYAGVYQRKYGLPIYATPKTLSEADRRHGLGSLKDVSLFFAGGKLRFGDISVESLPTPHDGADGAAFVVDAGGKRLGIMTDLGHVFEGLGEVMAELDAVFIESNYEPSMLAAGPYPAFLKRRIAGPGGHISNAEAAELLRACTRLKWACLSHLSGHNNSPEAALLRHRQILRRDLPLYIAGRSAATGIMRV
jgi:phosphoribosyl 1,2-cyclic phosphodiesterase